MELMRPSFFAVHSFRWQSRARRDICNRGERTAAFTAENRFGAGATRGFCWSQRQADLAIQPVFGLGFRLRWSGSVVERLSVLARILSVLARILSVLTRILSVLTRVLSVLTRILPVLARVLSVFLLVLSVLARVLSVLTRVLSVLTRVLSVNLGGSARIGEFEERHHRVFRHSQTDGRLQL